jgi:type I site-specific restriction-modification system R (restriction) subunit
MTALSMVDVLNRTIVAYVTDRKQLDEQIHGTFKSCGIPDPIVARSIVARSRRHLQKLLSNLGTANRF